MSRFCLLLFTLLLISGNVFSQEQGQKQVRILFQGIVMDASSQKPLPASQISLNRIFYSVSDSEGRFAFYVNTTDTLSFTRLGYVPVSMIVNDTLVGRQYVAGIYLNSDTLSIGEVVIVPRMKNIRNQILNSESKVPATMENAKYNVAVSAYSGRTTSGGLGDPNSNYRLLREKQTVDAYERGGIPSEHILGLSPFMIIPAAYMIMKGLPEKPGALNPDISDFELDQIRKKYLERGNDSKK